MPLTNTNYIIISIPTVRIEKWISGGVLKKLIAGSEVAKAHADTPKAM